MQCMFQPVVLFLPVITYSVQWSPHISVTQVAFFNIVALPTDGGQDNYVTSAELFYHPSTQ